MIKPKNAKYIFSPNCINNELNDHSEFSSFYIKWMNTLEPLKSTV